MHKNYFDIVMDHIEENVTKPTEEIKREIPKLIDRHSRAFNECFSILTKSTLDYYIKQRRLNYAVQDLVRCAEKSINDIALEYQFSDQAAFSRAVKTKYKVTPGEIRQNGLWTNEEPLSLHAFLGKKVDTQVTKLLQDIETGISNRDSNFELMIEIEHLCETYGFDIDIGYQIADLTEKLGVPLGFFGECCVNAMIDVQKDPLSAPAKFRRKQSLWPEQDLTL